VSREAAAVQATVGHLQVPADSWCPHGLFKFTCVFRVIICPWKQKAPLFRSIFALNFGVTPPTMAVSVYVGMERLLSCNGDQLFFGGARMITGFVCPHRLWSTGRLSGCFWIRLMFGIGNPSIVQRPQLMLVGLSRSLSTAETLSQAVVAWLIRRTVTSPVRRLVSY
jgi:hypothetical protein